VDAVVAAMAYRRTARLDDGVLKVETEARAVAPEFPAADSESAAAALRKLSFSNIFIRANAPSSPASASSSDKTDLRAVGAAEQEGGISARGAAALNSGKYDVAITEFTRAISLNPRSTNYVYDRGVAHFQKGDDDLAMADFNLSLRLDPTNSLALAARGVLELLQGKKDAAAKDFETALKLTPDRKALLLRRADAYHDSGDLPQAVEYYSEWLKAYPADAAVSTVEAQSCLARAELGRDVSAVLTACESLLKAKPRLTPARQGQALSLLRQFRYAEAVVVYDELVRETPDEPTALYGRGLARVGLGIRPQGQADLERAASSEAGVAQRFKRYGLAP
jgi:tetratricopeptide (TPR) repeat protein